MEKAGSGRKVQQKGRLRRRPGGTVAQSSHRIKDKRLRRACGILDTFHLLGSGYDRNTDYWLVMKDAEDGSELARIAFKIDVVFGLDFEF